MKLTIFFLLLQLGAVVLAWDYYFPTSDARVSQMLCSQSPEPGRCRRMLPMWYYDYETNKCVKTIFSICEGNDNRFHTKRECVEYCVS